MNKSDSKPYDRASLRKLPLRSRDSFWAFLEEPAQGPLQKAAYRWGMIGVAVSLLIVLYYLITNGSIWLFAVGAAILPIIIVLVSVAMIVSYKTNRWFDAIHGLPYVIMRTLAEDGPQSPRQIYERITYGSVDAFERFTKTLDMLHVEPPLVKDDGPLLLLTPLGYQEHRQQVEREARDSITLALEKDPPAFFG